jgi:hypothetical protein
MMICSPEGRAVAVHVHRGHADPTTVPIALEACASSSRSQRVILVGDRAMITSTRTPKRSKTWAASSYPR